MHSDFHDESSRAQIIPFQQPPFIRKPRTRGRPRKIIPKGTDYGTPELAMKRAHGLTAETLDLCLERELITQQQHWCGIHLRWLFTLRHGAPGVRALDPAHIAGHMPKIDDPEWRISREQEYRDAIHALALSGQVTMLLNVCIYNERPAFMTAPTSKEHAKRAEETLAGLKKGLDILVQLWNRTKRSR